jgi:DNA-binding MarR family transcriptional regulator
VPDGNLWHPGEVPPPLPTASLALTGVKLRVYTPIMDKPSRIPQPGKLDDPRNCVCFNLRKAARAVTQVYDEILRPTGLRATQHSLLQVLQLAGTMSVSQLAELAVMDRTTLARNLDLLEREGLVRIRPGAEDARVREVTLTPAAKKKLAAALPYWEKAQAQVTGKLGTGRSDQLLSDLFATVAAAEPGN